jgi:hypothetical protein
MVCLGWMCVERSGVVSVGSKSRKSTKSIVGWVNVKDAVRSNGDALSKVRDRPGKQWHGMPVTLVHTTSS